MTFNNESEMTWWGATSVYREAMFQHLPGGSRKLYRKTSHNAGIGVEIRSCDLWNMK